MHDPTAAIVAAILAGFAIALVVPVAWAFAAATATVAACLLAYGVYVSCQE